MTRLASPKPMPVALTTALMTEIGDSVRWNNLLTS